MDASPRCTNPQERAIHPFQHSGTPLATRPVSRLSRYLPFQDRSRGETRLSATATHSPQTQCYLKTKEMIWITKKEFLLWRSSSLQAECGPSSEVISDSSKMYSQHSISTLSSTTGLVSASTYSSPKAFSDLIDPIHANSLRWPRMTGSRPPLGGLSTAETLIKRCRLGGEETFCFNLALKDPWVRLSLFDVTPPDGCPAPVKRSIPHQIP